jgi:hypothetical protein
MIRATVAAVLAVLTCALPGHAQSAHPYDKLIATHAAANGVPEALVVASSCARAVTTRALSGAAAPSA